MRRSRTKIIDASSSAVTVYLTPREAQDIHIICQGHEQVDIYLPSIEHFPFNTNPITIFREKITQDVFIHCVDGRFQNHFDVAMTTISLDLYYSKTIALVKENRTNSEWYVFSVGNAGYQERSISAEIYGTSFVTQGTSSAYFFEGNYQTSPTTTNYASLRSYLYDHGYMDSKISTARAEIHFLKPGFYEREYQLNVVCESTEESTLRLRFRKLNDYVYEESSNDVLITSPAGTHTHSHISRATYPFITNLYATHTAFNTSGVAYDKMVVSYDIVVEGNGTWYFHPDKISNSNAAWVNRIKYYLVGDPDLQAAVSGRTSFDY